MLKRALMCGTTCLLLLLLSTYSQAIAKNDWELVLKTSFTLTDYSAGIPGVTVAGFYDEKHGIALCHHGEIHYTTDGGKSWSKADYPTFSTDLRGTDPRGLELLKADMAWCCGSNAIFL